jgi:hypothetical protein
MVLVSKGRTLGHEVEQKMSWIMDQVEVDVNDMVMVLQGSEIGIVAMPKYRLSTCKFLIQWCL